MDDNLAAYARSRVADMAVDDGRRVEELLTERERLAARAADAAAERRSAHYEWTAVINECDAAIVAIEAELAGTLPPNPVPPARIG